MLFQFSVPVDVTSVRIDPFDTWDRDVSYLLGNAGIPLNLTGVTYAGLGGVGFGGVQNDSALASSLFRDVSINGGSPMRCCSAAFSAEMTRTIDSRSPR